MIKKKGLIRLVNKKHFTKVELFKKEVKDFHEKNLKRAKIYVGGF